MKYYIEPADGFLQRLPHFYCTRKALLEDLTKKDGKPRTCTDPRCSRECWHAYGKKEAAIFHEYLLPLAIDGVVVMKGSIKLAKDATQEDHDAAQESFKNARAYQKKKTGKEVLIKCMTHVTDPKNKHYDFVAYSRDMGFKEARGWLEAAAEAAAFTFACVEIESAEELLSSLKYMFKVHFDHSQTVRGFCLPARDGKDIQFGSDKFFAGTTKDALWEKVKEKWFQVKKGINAESEDKPAGIFDPMYEWVVLPQQEKIEWWVPETLDEAIPLHVIEWGAGEDLSTILNTVLSLPGIRTQDGVWWLDRPGRKRKWTQKVFRNWVVHNAHWTRHLLPGNDPVPWWRLRWRERPPPYVRPVNTMTDEEFLRELEHLKDVLVE